MKTYKIILAAIAFIALWVAVAMADCVNPSRLELTASIVLTLLGSGVLIGMVLENTRAEQ